MVAVLKVVALFVVKTPQTTHIHADVGVRMCICTQHTGGVAPGEQQLNNTHAGKYKR